MLKLEKRQDAINQERLTDLKFLLSNLFDLYPKKLISATSIGKHEILRALLHGSHEFIDFSHVFANNDAIIDIDKNYHAIFHVEALIDLRGFETPILQSILPYQLKLACLSPYRFFLSFST